jgi:DNA-binding response OmpR family regulator
MPVGLSVLVVEDNAFVADLIAGALNDDGYGVATSATVTGAVRELRETEFNAVLLDCLLPDGDTAEVIAAAETREVPVILMSGDPEQINSAASLPFLTKPFSIEELLRTLCAVLTWAHSPETLPRRGYARPACRKVAPVAEGAPTPPDLKKTRRTF